MTAHPYETLTPQRVLDALADVGLPGDGRILQLNSYENRVFQVFLEDGRAIVAKFYRPGRWSDEQILEEHALARELADAEVPVVPPLVLGGDAFGDPPTLARFEVDGVVHRVAAAARCAGREPELEDDATLLQLGRFIGRLHAATVKAVGRADMRETLLNLGFEWAIQGDANRAGSAAGRDRGR